MFYSTQQLTKKYFNNWLKGQDNYLYIYIFILIFILSGCYQRASSSQLYTNPETGLSLYKHDNWKVTYTKRNGLITLIAKNGIINKVSSRIELLAGNCLLKTQNMYKDISYFDLLEEDINRIRILYNLKSVNFVQGPMEYEKGNKLFTSAIISIPTIAMKDDPNRIQVGNPKANKFQSIEIYIIFYNNQLIRAYIYKGNNEELNNQAHEIIESIQLDCTNNY